MNDLGVLILILIGVGLIVVGSFDRWVNSRRSGQTLTPEQAQERRERKLRGTEGGNATGFGGGGI